MEPLAGGHLVGQPNELRLATGRIGRRVIIFERLPSTNTHAAGLAHDPANDGLVVIAREQTGGRGQHGRVWQCPAGSGVLMSVLLFPPAPLKRPALLTAWAAVSVCETILQVTGLQAQIKWPNDVLIRGKKVCGILIEQGRGTVVGIGLNVNQSGEDLARAGLPVAGSLASLTEGHFDCMEIARKLIVRLDEEYHRMTAGDLGTLEACWRGLIGLIGKPVHVECLDGNRTGRLRDCTLECLEIELADRTLFRTPPENVRHLLALDQD
jgi:BirA family biotin operon repressor/biotin-[acetyl-CoA-carboxylase] ligase